MAYKIDSNECIGCGSCEAVCPQKCISQGDDNKFVIDSENCIDCGSCKGVCPVEAPKAPDEQ